jgi:hypothetical protein
MTCNEAAAMAAAVAINCLARSSRHCVVPRNPGWQSRLPSRDSIGRADLDMLVHYRLRTATPYFGSYCNFSLFSSRAFPLWTRRTRPTLWTSPSPQPYSVSAFCLALSSLLVATASVALGCKCRLNFPPLPHSTLQPHSTGTPSTSPLWKTSR